MKYENYNDDYEFKLKKNVCRIRTPGEGQT